jgi:hypothetical protein
MEPKICKQYQITVSACCTRARIRPSASIRNSEIRKREIGTSESNLNIAKSQCSYVGKMVLLGNNRFA